MNNLNINYTKIL